MTPVKYLVNPSAAELNAAIAEHVAKWPKIARDLFQSPAGGIYSSSQMAFAHSLDALMPYLEKRGWRGTSNRAGSTCAALVHVNSALGPDYGTHEAQIDDTQSNRPLVTAAAVALLRAHGLTVLFPRAACPACRGSGFVTYDSDTVVGFNECSCG